MKRRRLLGGLVGVGTVSLVGCLSNSDGPGGADTDDPGGPDTEDPSETDAGGGSNDTDSPGNDGDGSTDAPTGTPAPTQSPSPTPQPSVVHWGFDVTSNRCGTQVDEAEVAFDGDDDTVTVTGTIWGNDTAYTATIESVGYEDEGLVVTVLAERTSETAIAGQCIVEIGYEATVTVDGGLPGTVTVAHQHGEETTTVATVDR